MLQLAALSPGLNAQSAPVSYSIAASSSSVRAGENIDITLTLTTSVEIAGASIHVTYENGTYANFQSVGTTAFNFLDYHVNYADIVVICNNNSCIPGTYPVAKLTVNAAQSGTVRVTFTPKETADPQLELVAASGATGSYPISATAPASTSTTKNQGSTRIIPVDNGLGGTKPQQVTGNQFDDQSNQAIDVNSQTGDLSGNKTIWTPTNMLIAGLAAGLGLALFFFFLFKLFGRGSGRPRGPSGGSHSGGSAVVG